jgi:hypothetical protein
MSCAVWAHRKTQNAAHQQHITFNGSGVTVGFLQQRRGVFFFFFFVALRVSSLKNTAASCILLSFSLIPSEVLRATRVHIHIKTSNRRFCLSVECQLVVLRERLVDGRKRKTTVEGFCDARHSTLLLLYIYIYIHLFGGAHDAECGHCTRSDADNVLARHRDEQSSVASACDSRSRQEKKKLFPPLFRFC